jgi:hypothetical protein
MTHLSSEALLARFKTMRHIETVRNYLTAIIRHLLDLQVRHDQSKLESPEVEAYDVVTHKLRGLTYGSDEYRACLREMKPAIDHHYQSNPDHHPEAHPHGIHDLTLIEIAVMLADWKAATLRHGDGDIYKSIEINQERFKYSDELKRILVNTAHWLDSQDVYHKAQES